MFGNLWLSSALAVVAIVSTAGVFKSYWDIQEAKEIQENYQIISDLKVLIAKQYNKDPNQVTREEIIAQLPVGGNWEKVLLLDRKDSSTLENNALVDVDGNFVLDENDKIKLLALKAKLKSYSSDDTVEKDGSKYTFKVAQKDKNIDYKDVVIQKAVTKSVYILSELIYVSNPSLSLINEKIDLVKAQTPYDSIYHDMKKNDSENLTDDEIKARKEAYFKKRVKEELEKNNSGFETKVYFLVKDYLWKDI